MNTQVTETVVKVGTATEATDRTVGQATTKIKQLKNPDPIASSTGKPKKKSKKD
jgi:hypothetical protein